MHHVRKLKLLHQPWNINCNLPLYILFMAPSWSWSYGSWIYNYLCNQCLSPLMLWVQTLLRRGVFDTTLCDKVCQWLAADRWFSPGTPVSSSNKTDCHDIGEILLKVALNTINLNQAILFMEQIKWAGEISSHECIHFFFC